MKIREWLNVESRSVRYLAKQVGISSQALHLIEKGQSMPRLDTIVGIYKATGGQVNIFEEYLRDGRV